MRPVFQHYQHTRPIFALDLPGFGFSERSDRSYTPLLYANAVLDFLKSEVREPADVITLSLSSEFAAWAALAEPERFHSLAMISPTGFTARQQTRGSQRAAQQRQSDMLFRAFAFPLWSQAFYDLIATRPSIDYFLQKSFVGTVDPGLEDYAYVTSHQPGARYAPLHFVSGKLFTRDVVNRVYSRLTVPVLVLYDRDAFVRFDTLPEFVDTHSNWRREQIIPSNGLPQFERLPETTAALDRFWTDCSSLV
jgi:pimeloyl-ACP methyl ester carboxylesterase